MGDVGSLDQRMLRGSRWEVKEFDFTELSGWVATWAGFKKKMLQEICLESHTHVPQVIQGVWRWGSRA